MKAYKIYIRSKLVLEPIYDREEALEEFSKIKENCNLFEIKVIEHDINRGDRPVKYEFETELKNRKVKKLGVINENNNI